jgi:hypothetical protein
MMLAVVSEDAELEKEKDDGRQVFLCGIARAHGARGAAGAEALRLGEQMDLAEVRRARKLSQNEIGRALRIGPGSVVEIEKRADMYVSTLRRFIEAIGGELEIVARFADHSVKITNFADLAERERS